MRENCSYMFVDRNYVNRKQFRILLQSLYWRGKPELFTVDILLVSYSHTVHSPRTRRSHFDVPSVVRIL